MRHYERNEVECDNPFAFITKPCYAQLCVFYRGIVTVASTSRVTTTHTPLQPVLPIHRNDDCGRRKGTVPAGRLQ